MSDFEKNIIRTLLRGNRFVLISLAIGSMLLSAPAYCDGDETEFFIFRGRLSLVSTDVNTLNSECHSLVNYNRMLRNRNSLPSVDYDCKGSIKLLPPADKVMLEPASYLSGKIEITTKQDLFVIDIHDLLPKQLVDRMTLNRPYDGICFNTAMISAGIFKLNDFSNFNMEIESILGMSKFNVELSSHQLKINIRHESQAQLVTSRKMWTVDPDNVENARQVFQNMNEHLNHHFTPGSIICRTNARPLTQYEILQRLFEVKKQLLTKSNLKVTIEIKENDYIETSGLHCFTLMTPTLIVESNPFMPVGMVSFKSSYWHDLEIVWESKLEYRHATYFYFELDNDARNRFDQLISSRFKKMMKLFSRHRKIYESMIEIPSSTYPKFYDDLGNYVTQRKQLLDFLKQEMLPFLNSKLFSDYIKLEDEFVSNPKDLFIALRRESLLNRDFVYATWRSALQFAKAIINRNSI